MDSSAVSFRVAKEDLADAVAWVAKNLPSKATQPVLRAMLITADESGLELSGFDYEVSTKIKLPAEVETEGTIAVAGKLLADIVASLANKPVELKVDDSTALVRCGSSRFELPLIPLDDYPQLPELPQVTGSLNPALFTDAVTQVASAAGRDDTLPMLTGVNFAINGSNIKLAATDRFRLAIRQLTWDPASEDVSAKLLVPAKTLQENARSLDTSLDQPVQIAVGAGDNVGAEGLFGLHSHNRETTTRMLDAEFPNIEPLLPKTHSCVASVDIAPLQEAIRRVSLLTERNAQVRMEFSEDQVILSAGGAESGHAEEAVPCEFSGRDELIIAFNPGYLKDGLSVVRTEKVFFGFTESSRPAILLPQPEQMPEANEDGQFPSPESEFTYLLMPVRLPG